ncbi:MAG: 4a-hydroxytetrahydrobiopterin dehydratase [Alphaproteobacteria bacterium]|nr:4a-hydroxytetrahydrobiopterin dehydratase [Alphaproteobacteria bacterium]
MVEKIHPEDIENSIQNLEGWSKTDGKEAIFKEFIFSDFVKAFEFMTKCAQYAEEINHHPEWFNVYNRVEVTLNTHDVNGLSELDLKTAQKMNELAA